MIRLHIKDFKHFLSDQENYILILKDYLKICFLQTCNRVELYFREGEVDRMITNHLFRVVSGLESALVGETAIQKQLKRAYLKLIKRKKIFVDLHQPFQNALRVVKSQDRNKDFSWCYVLQSDCCLDNKSGRPTFRWLR